MLTENEVIDAVCKKLQLLGYHIDQKSLTNQKGYDMVALKQTSPSHKLFIEAKGATSSKEVTNRFGEPFKKSQIFTHVSKAFYKAAEVLSLYSNDIEVRAGIALPDTQNHREYIHNISPVLKKLGIIVFWVKSNHEVEIV